MVNMDNTARPSGLGGTGSGQMTARTRGGSWARAVVAYALVSLSPAGAWLVWISWSDGRASDAMHVTWFVTVATICLVAGVLAPHGRAHYVALTVVAVLATMTTLFWWWAAEDSSGLFIIGIIIAAPPVTVAAAVLLVLGRYLTPSGTDHRG